MGFLKRLVSSASTSKEGSSDTQKVLKRYDVVLTGSSRGNRQEALANLESAAQLKVKPVLRGGNLSLAVVDSEGNKDMGLIPAEVVKEIEVQYGSSVKFSIGKFRLTQDRQGSHECHVTLEITRKV